MTGYNNKGVAKPEERGRLSFDTTQSPTSAPTNYDVTTQASYDWKAGVEVEGTEKVEVFNPETQRFEKKDKVPVLRGTENALDALNRVCNDALARRIKDVEDQKKSTGIDAKVQ